MNFRTIFAFISLSIFFQYPAYAQINSECELHVWTTKNIQATFNGATVGFISGNPVVTGMTYSPLQDVAQRLAKSVDVSAQRRIFELGNLGAVGRFRGYKLVFHDAPEVDRYPDLSVKNLGNGSRDSDSTSSCYAEIHVLYISLLRTAIGKKILTGFLYREFGPSGDATSWLLKTPGTGAAGFHTNGEAKSQAEIDSVREAVRKNLQSFLRSRRFKIRGSAS